LVATSLCKSDGRYPPPHGIYQLRTAFRNSRRRCTKAKAEPGYRFYALYDKISREDILAQAYAQCRSNNGAPGVDRQDFEAVETYGVERWLGELALALSQEGIVKLNSILPVWAPGCARASLFLLMNRCRARRDSKPKIAYTYLP
jgi:hypothetical protein